MKQVKINLTIEQKVWQKFSILVPKQKKSKIINELLKQKVKKISQPNEEKTLTISTLTPLTALYRMIQ